MPIFHTTMSQGRGDTLYLHATSKNKLLFFLNSVSTAVIRNIKEVVYSKTFGINATATLPYIESEAYHKVVIFAYSKNYSQQFILYNVKKSVNEDFLKKEYKKLFILNEKIEGFFTIDFYNEVAQSDNIDNLYQVQYKRNSKTYTEEFYADSYQKVKDFFETIIDGELLEIRKYVHLDNSIKKDDGDYLKRMSLYITDNKFHFSASIPKIKKNLEVDDLKELITNNLNFHGKPIEKDDIKLTFR